VNELRRGIIKKKNELRQHWESAGHPDLPAAPKNAHDALADARHNLVKWRAIEEARSAH